ncbi:MAG: lipoyl(octanoyl) transferase LipB [Deltaproteobacteria bacterium]|nr:lipoyl(octanoyl) transferase LipB [Deltaproteobacteria bacterium]
MSRVAESAERLAIEWLGRVDYAESLELQERALEARRRDEVGDRLLLLEHPPVVTLGRSADRKNLLLSAELLALRGIALHEVRRGGDVTYHAPGQLVGYLIADLKARGRPDVHLFLRDLEQALIEALAELGVPGRRSEGRTGVFVDDPAGRAARDRKIASIGIGVRRWVTCHGFALNVSLDLAGFEAIVPCGLADVEMTSVARELGESCKGAKRTLAGAPADLDARARQCVARAFSSHFG